MSGEVGQALMVRGATDAMTLVDKARESKGNTLDHWDEVADWPSDRQFLALIALVETVANDDSRAALIKRIEGSL